MVCAAGGNSRLAARGTGTNVEMEVPMRRYWIAGIAALLVLAAGVVSLVVEQDATYALVNDPVALGQRRALVLYHPSRDARFADDLAQSLRDGLREAGFAVDLATTTAQTPTDLSLYAVVGVVSNTYWWSPDRPTLRYLRRISFNGLPVLGVMGGAGSTGRSERVLRDALTRAGGRVVEVSSAWLWRPNDEARMNEPNRAVARDMIRAMGQRVGRSVL
jgi:hypothetical protein